MSEQQQTRAADVAAQTVASGRVEAPEVETVRAPAMVEVPAAVSHQLSPFFPRNFTELSSFADLLSGSDMVPKDYQGRKANIMLAWALGDSLGVNPLQALWNIAVVNGRPRVWGDLGLVLVRQHVGWVEAAFREWEEEITGEGLTAHCRVGRFAHDGSVVETVRTFSAQDQKLAGLGTSGGGKGSAGAVHSAYPKRMRQMRARWFALRDVFADALMGVTGVEEVGESVQDAYEDGAYEPEGSGRSSSAQAARDAVNATPLRRDPGETHKAPEAAAPAPDGDLVDAAESEPEEVTGDQEAPTARVVHDDLVGAGDLDALDLAESMIAECRGTASDRLALRELADKRRAELSDEDGAGDAAGE